LVINHNIIPQTNSVKYLGVTLENTLSWQPHIDKISNKLSRVCGMAFKPGPDLGRPAPPDRGAALLGAPIYAK